MIIYSAILIFPSLCTYACALFWCGRMGGLMLCMRAGGITSANEMKEGLIVFAKDY